MNKENKALAKSFPRISVNDRIDLKLIRDYEFAKEQRLLLFEIKFEEDFINRLKNFMMIGANNFINLWLDDIGKIIINKCILRGFKISKYKKKKTLIVVFEFFVEEHQYKDYLNREGITTTTFRMTEKQFYDMRKEIDDRMKKENAAYEEYERNRREQQAKKYQKEKEKENEENKDPRIVELING